MNIKCRKITCGYNDCTVCNSEEIMIGEKLECKTFTKHNKLDKKKNKPSIFRKNRFETGKELTNYKSDKVKLIKCRSKDCLFNENSFCTANGISVLCGEKCGFCGSHLKR